VAEVNINGNYYSIRKVPMGRGGVSKLSSNFETGAEQPKNYFATRIKGVI